VAVVIMRSASKPVIQRCSVTADSNGTFNNILIHIQCQISYAAKKANGVFVQPYPVWKNLNISKEAKIQIFNTNVKSVLLYACETWKTTN